MPFIKKVAGVSVSKKSNRLTSLFKNATKKVMQVLPAVLMGALVATPVLAGGTDLLAPGDANVGATLGSDATIWKWVLLGEAATAAVTYIITKKFSALGGIIILSVFINVALLIAGY
ncbi:conjugal transfer protein TraA [Budviciaceae bacterium BWR-B9]|uniref:Pilin n=1 Tax=Limnobaculum allomyrinae TaxID=2791986 RepID=A0ABS1IUY8_9GAMM|nr:MULTISPECIES: type IV conjugative transfer system pilin TraA [Limnobaculum]MBK5145553.1 conjugal transfer protein TraA [Limnobaculum allomyrinae]MBV7693671.1 conjugal transfer protein TraA [Limnobaculum sp. M2-1]